MAIKKYSPRTPGLRFRTGSTFEELTEGKKPEKALTRGLRRCSGRDAQGRTTVRHRGGGHKRKYRKI
ncbi:MAG: 50S ribosomal protein L2, partial [Candidatus Hydrogenedentota bacterium]